MSRIEQLFKTQQAYVGYVTAGMIDLETTVKDILALVDGGINIIEIGVPFSDPVADGPIIQEASMRAIEHGTSIADVLDVVASVRGLSDVPIILFSYFNPILQALPNQFLQQAKEAGVDGCLIVDLPIEEAEAYCRECNAVDIDPIMLVSPSTSVERIADICQYAKGMLYYVCRNGVTGIQSALPDGFAQQLQLIRSISHLPVVAGFGISNKAMANDVLAHADGFVVGSKILQAILEGTHGNELSQLVRKLDPRQQHTSLAV